MAIPDEIVTPSRPPPTDRLTPLLSRRWWLVLLKGVIALLFGVAALVWPKLTVQSLVVAWGAYALLDGVLSLGLAFSRRGGAIGARLWIGLLGLCGLVAGLFALLLPRYATPLLGLYIGVWAMIAGVLQVAGAIYLRKEISGERMLVLAGLMTLGLGVILLVRPSLGALIIAGIVGGYAILLGVDFIALALRLRREGRPRPRASRRGARRTGLATAIHDASGSTTRRSPK